MEPEELETGKTYLTHGGHRLTIKELSDDGGVHWSFPDGSEGWASKRSVASRIAKKLSK